MTQPGADGIPRYLQLLHLDGSGVRDSLETVRAIIAATPSAWDALTPLLNERNWRSHLVAAVAVLFVDEPRPFAAPLWRALDAGTWVSPQLAVVLSLIDPEFSLQAHERLSATALLSTRPKLAAAIAQLLGERSESRTWINGRRADPAFRAHIAMDQDAGDQLAARWETNLRAHWMALGLVLPSAAT